MTIALFEALNEIKDTLSGPLAISALPGGDCNRLFKVEGPAQTAVLRLNHPEIPSLGVDRQQEINILLNLSNEAWSLKLIAASPRWLLYHWAPGDRAPQGKCAELSLLAHALVQVHHHRPQGKPLNIADRIQHLKGHAEPLPAQVDTLLRNRCDSYSFVKQPVLCHHDWHPGNLIRNGAHWTLLDWEFAAAGDPAMDLASLCKGFGLSSAQSLGLAAELSISPERLMQARCLMEGLAMVWYRANPWLAPDTATSAEGWYNRWR